LKIQKLLEKKERSQSVFKVAVKVNDSKAFFPIYNTIIDEE
jgi:hypothetical protein